MRSEILPDTPVMTFVDSAAWEAWLRENYADQTGVWIKIAKKDSGIASVTQPEALDVCLCYGWIDGLRKSYDDKYYLQKYTPRRKKSLWSKVNIGKVEELIAAGRVQEPGLAEIERAKADGRWDAAYESSKNAVVPDDLIAALEQNEKAKAFFESFNKTERYAVLWRLMTAKTPEIRQARLEKMITLMESGTKV